VRFAALKAYFSGRPWTEWGPDLAFRDADALAAADTTLGEEMDYERYVQFLLSPVGARAARRAARRRRVGDIPIYVAHDSADVWARQDLFSSTAPDGPVPSPAFRPTTSARRGSSGAIRSIGGTC
jgi:4-alpha-glucanotransferase